METTVLDPWESAEHAEELQYSKEVWGQVLANSWYCVLEKGVGKVEFDPQKHNQDQRRTAIDITIYPLADMKLNFNIERSMIAESREWVSFILPSIRNCGIGPRELNEKWVKVQMVTLTDKTGNPVTYTDDNGTVKEKTTIQFLKIFKNLDDCRQDYLAQSGKPAQSNTQYAGNNGNGNDKEKQTALSFLKVYVQNVCRSQKDLNAIRQSLAEQIAQQPLISKYFTVDSPETVNLIAKEMESIPF
jgi:hypothetical protein